MVVCIFVFLSLRVEVLLWWVTHSAEVLKFLESHFEFLICLSYFRNVLVLHLCPW